MPKGPTIKMRRRLNFVVITAIMLAFVLVLFNIVNITVVQHDVYYKRAMDQQLRPEKIQAKRGTIYDRNMGVIAQSATVYDVILSPRDVQKTPEQIPFITTKLAEVLSNNENEKLALEKKIAASMTKTGSAYEVIMKKVEKSVADKVRELITTGMIMEGKKTPISLKGISLVENAKRYYPNNTFASSLIGFTNVDGEGLYGVELSYDKELSGTPGYTVSAKNAMGENMPVSFEERFDPINGNNLVLTVDESIQHFLENSLEMAMNEHKPKEGAAGIVMNVRTGEILAMANYPNFDLNNPWIIHSMEASAAVDALPDDQKGEARLKAQQAQWSNKAVSYAYEPGSTFKTVVAAAALDEKTSSLKSTFYCPGYVIVMDQKMACHIGIPGHGSPNFTEAMVGSCNPAFVKIGADLGAANFFKYFNAFGLTEKTGIDLPGEGKSHYYTEKGLQTVQLASCSFGQSLSLTPIQVITAVSAVVNGGNLITPHVVKDILDQNGNIIRSVPTEVKRQVISAETSAMLRTMMEEVVDVKGGTNAAIMGYRIGGKSGTSQKLNNKDKEARIASYVAVAPIDDPEIAVIIMVDEPTSGDIFGSVVGAPVAGAVLAEALPYLGYMPKYTKEQEEKLEVSVPNLLRSSLLESTSKLALVGIGKPQVFGEGITVVKQVPSGGSKMPRDGKVIVYTEDIEQTTVAMPAVVDLSPDAAKAKIEKLNLNVSIKGLATDHKNSKITNQSVEAGEIIPIGTVVEITCIKADTD